MKIKNLLLLGVVVIFLAASCKKNTSETTDVSSDINDLVIPEGFTFETTRDVSFTILMPKSINFEKLKSRFSIYSALPSEGGKLITSGSFNEEGVYNGVIRIPSALQEIVVTTVAGTIKASVSEQNAITIDFGARYVFSSPKDAQTKKGNVENSAFSMTSLFPKTSKENLVGNGDFETDDFGEIFKWQSSQPVDSRWYMTTSHLRMYWEDQGGNHVVAAPYNVSTTGEYGACVQSIIVSPGDVITLSADVKSSGVDLNDEVYAFLYIVPLNEYGTAIKYFGVECDLSNKWENNSVVATIPRRTKEVKIILFVDAFEGQGTIYFDNVVVKGPGSDSDNDGVDDDLDDYPNDASKAFDVYYPNHEDWGTFAFEDLWPGKGDYDFNDLVVDYQYKSVLNADNELVDLHADYSVRAIGASMMNGFGIQMPGDPENVSNVTGTYFTENYLNLNSNGTENNQSSTVVFLFDNSFNMIGSSGSEFINTEENSPYVSPDTNHVHVSFNNPVKNPGQAPYNPFIVVDADRGLEVHLAGYSPTDLADISRFGTWADDSDPASGKYYQTENNLPWAIDIPESFDYPIEQTQIIKAYNHFSDWGESGGRNYSDWYKNKTGYRNDYHIYTPVNR